MKIYQCDSCKKVIRDPYTERMKEFKIESSCFEYFHIKRKIKIQLCSDCFMSLRQIAKEKENDDDQL